MIGFDDGTEPTKHLDGRQVQTIHANLSCTSDISTVHRLSANSGIAFIGSTKKAPLDIPLKMAMRMLLQPNPHGRPNSDVIHPYANGLSVTRRPSDQWIIDFGEKSKEEASLYESPFQFVSETVYPIRAEHREPRQKEKWWLLARSCPDMKEAVYPMDRFIVTPTVCKYRVFSWLSSPTNPDHQLYVFSRSDDYFFGILNSRLHEIWGLRLGTRLETRPRYTPTTCFETFPFPCPTGTQRMAVEKASSRLDALRRNWLNPPEWLREEVLEFPGSTDGPWARYVHDPDERGVGTVRYSRLVAKDAHVYNLAKRTLTNLYNERPTWLDLAHKALDEAVFDAYGWGPSMTDEQILAGLLKLNLERSTSSNATLAADEAEEETIEVDPE